MFKTLFEYDDDEPCDLDLVFDRLTEVCEDLLKKNKKGFTKWGFFGTWCGPEYGGSFLQDLKNLRGHICQDFSVPMSFSLKYTDEDAVVCPLQRYCAPTSITVPKGSLLLTQYHHDGCNVYILRQYVSGDHPKTAKTKNVVL